MKNQVANIAKIYAILNGIACVIMGFVMMEDALIIGAVFLGVGVVMSFFIYCIGEGIQLLQDIKDGTKDTTAAVKNTPSGAAPAEAELPSI